MQDGFVATFWILTFSFFTWVFLKIVAVLRYCLLALGSSIWLTDLAAKRLFFLEGLDFKILSIFFFFDKAVLAF